MRCEDYPCCGHTDGLPCDWTAPDYSNDPHLMCDHEAGICDVWHDAEDEYCCLEYLDSGLHESTCEEYDPTPCCPDPGCAGRYNPKNCDFPGYADNH